MLDLNALEHKLAKDYAGQESGLFFHNWDHTLAVRKYAVLLGKALNADLNVIEPAALLHDSGYVVNTRSSRHEEESVEYARELAKDPAFKDLAPILDDVVECILATRIGETSELVEARIIKDADLIQFSLENYPKKVFELNFELNANKKVRNLTLKEFVRETPGAMKKWVSYDEETGEVGYLTEPAKELASDGFKHLYNMFMFFREISEELSDSEFQDLYVKFLMELEDKRKSYYHEIVRDEFLETIARGIYFKEKLARTEREYAVLRNAELKINEGLSMNEVIDYILQATVEAMEAHTATLFTVETDGKIHFANTHYSEFITVTKASRDALLSMKPLDPGQGIVGHVIQELKPRLVEDTSRDADHFKKPSNDLAFQVKSMLTVPILYYGEAIGAMQIINKDSAGRIISFNQNDVRLAEGMCRIAGVAINRARLFDSIIKTFIDLINARDNYTRRHTDGVTEYALRLGKAIGMDEKDLKKVRYSAGLHDLGKIGTPENILNKPGKLTESEFEVMRDHVVLPEKVKSINFPPYLADVPFIASCHHERYDGKGYVKGLKGEDIPLIARILAVADVYDAVTSERPYRKSMPIEKALEILREGRGTQFDPKFVDVFIDGKLYLNPGDRDAEE